MFDQLFEVPRTIILHDLSPLALERSRYLIHLTKEGMAKASVRSIAEYLLVIVEYLKLAERSTESVCRDQVAEAADRWANRDRRPYTVRDAIVARRRFLGYATRWLTFLDRFRGACPVSSPYTIHIADYAAYMDTERGLSPRTITQRCIPARNFLSHLCETDRMLDTVSISPIDTLLAQQVENRGYSRITVQTHASSLRSFFRYAEYRGWCATGLASAIMAPRVFRHESLPSGPSWIQVQKLLASIATLKAGISQLPRRYHW